MAKHILVDGSEKVVTPKNGKHFSLAELQTFVGGYIEMLILPNRSWLILNEEGKLKGLPRNERATVLGHACGIADDDFIVGDVLVASATEVN